MSSVNSNYSEAAHIQMEAWARLLSGAKDEQAALQTVEEIVDWACHDPSALSSEDRQALEKDLADLSAPAPEEEKSASSKPKTEKPFFSRKWRQLRHASKKTAHAVRDFGRGLRQTDLSKSAIRVTELDKGSASAKALGHKVARFWDRHKTEILVGAAVAVVVTGVAVAAAYGATGVASGVAAAGGGALTSSNTDKPAPSSRVAASPSAPAAKPAPSSRSIFDSDFVLREAIQEEAAQKAKEQRYPHIAHSASELTAMRKQADDAMQKFKSDIASSFDPKTAAEVIAVGATLYGTSAALATGTPPIAAGAAFVGAGVAALHITKEAAVKAAEYYQPVVEAQRGLYRMEQANGKASAQRCEATQYEPRLEYDPHQTGPGRTTFTDKANPNPTTIIINASDDM